MPVKKVKSSKLKVQSKKVAGKPARPVSGSHGLNAPMYSLAGRVSGILSLPKEVFGQKINQTLLAQAVRVYITNKSAHPGKTKTRGEVEGSSAKIWRQKGTGRARHGSIRAPIFVGGGINFGPTPRKVTLNLPKKMKKAALFSALSVKSMDKQIIGLSGLEKATGKTKEMANLLQKQKIKNALIVTGEKMDNVVRSIRNIPGINAMPARQINAYEILKHDMLLITKEAVEKIAKGEK